jgi:predicted  nucleic acid-binding Zn-ribbon protein
MKRDEDMTDEEFSAAVEEFDRGAAGEIADLNTALETAESEARALRDEVRRMRNRIESLRGALKTASGWIWEGAGTEIEANERADKCIEMAGDMEPPLKGSNV